MSDWEQYKEIFKVSSLEELYSNHIVLSGATGIDRVNHETFFNEQKKHLGIISKKAIAGTYKFSKYKLKLISKGRGKEPREISIPTIRDRILLRGLCDYLNLIFKGDLNFDLPQNVIKIIKKSLNENKFTSFIKLDVQSFYPNIDQKILLDRLRRKIKKDEILNIIKFSITTPTVEKASEVIEDNNKGVPQGLSISNVLAAIYLADIDKKLSSEDFAYFRYVDDILVLCDNNKTEDITKEIVSEFGKIKLKVHEPSTTSEKSTIGDIEKEEFTYLGYKFSSGTVSVRDTSVDRLRDSLTSIFTAFKYSKKKDESFLLWRLNLRITGCIFENKRKGWLFFFSEITDLDLLHRLDHYMKLLCKRFEVKIKPKSFVRAYFQLKHHFYESTYIPNFDKYSIDDMKGLLNKYFSFDQKELDKMTHRRVKYLFLKRISKQVRDLDTDLQDFS